MFTRLIWRDKWWLGFFMWEEPRMILFGLENSLAVPSILQWKCRRTWVRSKWHCTETDHRDISNPIFVKWFAWVKVVFFVSDFWVTRLAISEVYCTNFSLTTSHRKKQESGPKLVDFKRVLAESPPGPGRDSLGWGFLGVGLHTPDFLVVGDHMVSSIIYVHPYLASWSHQLVLRFKSRTFGRLKSQGSEVVVVVKLWL